MGISVNQINLDVPSISWPIKKTKMRAPFCHLSTSRT